MPSFVRVAVPLPVHGLFTYAIPDDLAPERLPVGAEVRVPFGGRSTNGWVVERLEVSDIAAPRPIEALLNDTPAFTPDQLVLYRWIADYWLAPVGEVIAAATPSGAAARTRHVYVPTDEGIAVLAQAEPPTGDVATVLREIVARPGLTKTALARRLHGEIDDVPKGIAAVVQRGWAEGDDVAVEGARDVEKWAVRVADPAPAQGASALPMGARGPSGSANQPAASELSTPNLGAGGFPPPATPPGASSQEAAPRRRAAPPRPPRRPALPPSALAALEALAEGPRRAAELDARGLARLVRDGLVALEERPRLGAWMALPARTAPPELNDEQRAAVDAVTGPGTYLLHGVTGAGKTEVYLALAARALEPAPPMGARGPSDGANQPAPPMGARGPSGGANQPAPQVLVLVPEIALTPQLLDRFAARFGERVAVLHSQLTGVERLREWRRIRAGAVDVAVGARSAVFAPFRRLGLVVVDEENDDSYKQEEGVRYHARDVAVVRGRMASCPVILGSATPSLESWENARAGRYRLLTIRNRATSRAVPRPEIVDMRKEDRVDGREPLLSAAVRDAVRAALDAGGQAILLHNRRGYATFVECPGCGLVHECPSCGISLVYHQGARRLDCHYCGFHRAFQPTCRCGSTVEVFGRGTERVEEAVAAAFPDVPVARMDADTTAERGAHARILADFRERRTRLLVGTQIVAKGHDFPGVHVAAVLGADHILGMPDFRSAERTFALVTQLCGRAGRGSVPGRVFVQTHHPEHPVFGCIGDMEAFVAHEERVRRMLGYPPWSRLVLVRVEAVDRAAAEKSARELAALAREQARGHAGVDVLGPALAPLPRLVGRWRFQVVMRGRQLPAFRKFIAEHHATWKVPGGVRRILDVDPRSIA